MGFFMVVLSMVFEQVRNWFEFVFYEYMYGDWDSLNKLMWIYLHVGIMLMTVLLGASLAMGDYVISVLLLPFPIVFLYRRYTYARPT